MDTAGRKQILETPNVILNPYRYAAAGGGITDPTDIAGCVIWQDIDTGLQEADTTFPEAGDTVTAWANSGSGADPDSVSNCVYRTGPTRLEATAAAGVVLWNTTTNPLSGDSSTTAFYVVDTTDAAFILAGSASTGTFMGVVQSGSGASPQTNAGSPSYYVNGSLLSSPTRGDLYTNIATGSPVIVAVTGFNQSASNWSDLGLLYYAGAGFDYTGDCYELIVYDSNLSDTDRGSVESYLASRWSISI